MQLFNWLQFVMMLAVVLQLAVGDYISVEELPRKSVAELARIFRSNPEAMARFQELFGDGMNGDVARLSNLQRLG
ncbi:hypothetical protein V3C99_010963 [Haemonchus contortus]|uniref:Secreted protein n=1 Tax=Haemonchus contortus TaxID=6289 RepID=A0A7I4Y6L7_HAECO|nr:unnamed protein product [Haemonchus contortus]